MSREAARQFYGMGSSREMSEGRWVENDARWFEMQMRYCALCGQVIPGRFWEVEIEGSP